MAKPFEPPRMTEADYLAWEVTQPRRHEYVEGRIYAIQEDAEEAHVDVEDPRARVARNLANALTAHLRETACEAHLFDMRLYVPAAAAYLYPDVVVSCPGRARPGRSPAAEPLLIADVPSPAAGSLYPGVRFARYRCLPSLREYLLVDTRRRSLDIYRKGADGLWELQTLGHGDTVPLTSLDLPLPAALLFAGLA